MSHTIEVEYNGFTFLLALGLFSNGGSIIIDIDSPLDNPAFIEGLRQAQKHVKYYQAVGHLEEYPVSYFYRADYSNDPDLLAVVEAYENKIIPVSDEIYQLALSFMTGRAFLKTHKPKVLVPGYTYLMCDSQGLYKIGHSKDPATRLKSVTRKVNPTTLICQIKSDQANYLEYELHEKFDAKRVRGEWFELSSEDIDYIKSLAVGS